MKQKIRESTITKICIECGQEKPISDYWKRSAAPDGLQYDCRDCTKARKRAHYAVNREEEIKRSAIWNKRNAAKVARNMRNCRERRPEHFKKYVAEWKKKNPDLVQAWDANKCARRRAAIKDSHKITGDEWTSIKANQKHRCWYCDKKTKLTIDHVVPLASGGLHISDNIVAACLSCNSRKSDLDIKIFAQRNGRLFF